MVLGKLSDEEFLNKAIMILEQLTKPESAEAQQA